MSTNSLIGIETETGLVQGIYCHWDGYPEHNGRILAEHYTNPEKVERLISGGSLSALAPEIGEQNSFRDTDTEVCLYYHRDRGEPGPEIIPARNAGEFYFRHKNSGAEFVYLFTGGRWIYSPCVGNAPQWKELAIVGGFLQTTAAATSQPAPADYPF